MPVMQNDQEPAQRHITEQVHKLKAVADAMPLMVARRQDIARVEEDLRDKRCLDKLREQEQGTWCLGGVAALHRQLAGHQVQNRQWSTARHRY